MKKYLLFFSVIVILGLVFFIIKTNFIPNTNQSDINTAPEKNTGAALINTTNINFNENINSSNAGNLQPPLDRASERVTKKPFGIYITKANSPVQPERFTGYHTGADFEVFPEELNTDISVHAICNGSLKLKEKASGYGGIAVQVCRLNGEDVTIIYGHLKLSSIAKNSGEELSAGETIGILGQDYSTETDGERKHLHLGIHKATAVNIRGYVTDQKDLSDWIEPCLYVCL